MSEEQLEFNFNIAIFIAGDYVLPNGKGVGWTALSRDTPRVVDLFILHKIVEIRNGDYPGSKEGLLEWFNHRCGCPLTKKRIQKFLSEQKNATL